MKQQQAKLQTTSFCPLPKKAAFADTAIILAGGKSSRFGGDKRKTLIDGVPLLEHVMRQLQPLFGQIIVGDNRPEQYSLAVQQVPDMITGSALAGLYSGLSHARSLYSFVVACDMPFINVNYIAYLKKQLSQQSYLAAATLYEDWGEPLHGFYHQALQVPLAEFLLSGQKSMFRFLQSQQEQVLFVPEAVARGFSPDWRMFFNINTPKDLEEYHILKQWTENLAT